MKVSSHGGLEVVGSLATRADELDQLVKSSSMLEVVHTMIRARPPGGTGYHRRKDTDMLRDMDWPPEQDPLMYICGTTNMLEATIPYMHRWGQWYAVPSAIPRLSAWHK